jgi:hypothetical protein
VQLLLRVGWPGWRQMCTPAPAARISPNILPHRPVPPCLQVPYSEHSSFSELRQFVDWFRPVRCAAALALLMPTLPCGRRRAHAAAAAIGIGMPGAQLWPHTMLLQHHPEREQRRRRPQGAAACAAAAGSAAGVSAQGAGR